MKSLKEILKTIVGGKDQKENIQMPQITAISEQEMKELIMAKMNDEEEQLREPSSHLLGLFTAVEEEKIAELTHAFLVLQEYTKNKKPAERKPIDFYISTYGGSADDMFALYDVMRITKEDLTIRTVGLGKVMSAGVLLLAAGTNGERKIAKNCRIMIHSVIGGNHGSLHNMMNEMEAIEQLQQMFIDCLVEETNMTKTQLKKMLDRKVNVYLSAEEAVELGIADIII
jgi:ATP-dependent Clp protease protease subunit